jgi:hypothetical protein
VRRDVGIVEQKIGARLQCQGVKTAPWPARGDAQSSRGQDSGTNTSDDNGSTAGIGSHSDGRRPGEHPNSVGAAEKIVDMA